MALLPLNKQTFNIMPERSSWTEKEMDKHWGARMSQNPWLFGFA